MKKLIILLTLGLFIACSATRGSHNTANSRKTTSPYRIKKIVDEETFFIIYAARNDSTFKIVSRIKDPTDFDGEKIRVGKSYILDVGRIFPPVSDTLLGIPTTPNLGIGMGMGNGKGVTLEGESHYIIYTALNLNGLYLKKD